MKIGVVKEIKKHEYRVGVTPAGARAFAAAGHKVTVQSEAGVESGFPDDAYAAVGAEISGSAEAVYTSSDMVFKVKEPLAEEYRFFREDLIIYTYLHLAADKGLTEAMLDSGVKGVAFETITDRFGGLPCLRPMSEIAGRLSVQVGAKYLERPSGGSGVLLGGVPGVSRGKVVIIGGGIAGFNACKIAVNIGAEVTILDINLKRLAEIEDLMFGRITTLYNSETNLESALSGADLVIGAVLIPGHTAPRIVKKEHLRFLKPGAVAVDIAIDQGGCFETSRVTYHDDPVYIVDGIVHYCVGNMPGAVPRTSTVALENTTLPFGLAIANMGLEAACAADPHLAAGVNTYNGKCTCLNVAESLGLEFGPL